MILTALLLAAAPVPLDGPTASEAAAICAAQARSADPAFLDRLAAEVDLSRAEEAQLRRECTIYLAGKRDALAEVRRALLTRPGRADEKRRHGEAEERAPARPR